MHIEASAENSAEALRRREAATAEMIRQIDSKLARLAAAKRARISALSNIRSELARRNSREQVAAEFYERAS